ncbi:PPE family protein [Corallococcus soli]
MATGVMSSTSIAMLSPGITISTLSGSFTVPVTSVVRK